MTGSGDLLADQRRFPRLDVPIDGTWDGASGLRTVRVTSLSLGGCFVDGLGDPSMGERTSVTLRFGDGTTLCLPGDVVYRDRVQGFGVRFCELAAEEEAWLIRGLQLHGLPDPRGGAPGA
jgi:hypothetical protein